MAVQTVPTTTAPRPDASVATGHRRAIIGSVALAVVFVAALTWSKWYPYVLKVGGVADSGVWSKPSVLDSAGPAGSSASLSRGWDYTVAYGKSVWMAYVAVLVLAAASTSLVPRAWLRRMLSRSSDARGTVAGGLFGTITLFCTACAAPLAVSMRRDGVRSSSTLAYLYAAPVLNPAVIAILALVGPWQWAAVRIVVGLVLVFGLSALVARLDSQPTVDETPELDLPEGPRFVRRLVGLAVTLTPIYLVLTFLQGAFRGVAFPLDGTTMAVAGVVIALLLGTIIDIPTAGEVPILLALTAAGVSTAAAGALLITLPAISLITMVMMLRSHGVRVTAAAGAAVVVAGGAAAALLVLIS